METLQSTLETNGHKVWAKERVKEVLFKIQSMLAELDCFHHEKR